MFDLFSRLNQDVHEIVVFSLDSPINNEGQGNVRWPNYATDGLFTFCCRKTEIAKVTSIARLKYMKVTYEYIFEYILIA